MNRNTSPQMPQNFLQPALIRKKVRKEEKEKMTDASQIFNCKINFFFFNCKINLTKLQKIHTGTHVLRAVFHTLPKAFYQLIALKFFKP